ncbi:MAG: peptide chain release factor N(5)-glutamine methyltransferase [PVC group bacterium]
MTRLPVISFRPSAPAAIRTELSRAGDLLEKSGVENPRLDAEHLLAHCLGTERGRLYLDPDRVLTTGESERFWELLEERRDRRPLAYIRGWAGFYSLVLKTDARALIPRPESELLIDRALAILEGCRSRPPEVVDLGCGCGTLALALAKEAPGVVIRASDISGAALDLARENAVSLGLADAVSFRPGDLFSPWEDRRPAGFDLVVANPPYLSDREWEEAPPEVRRHEPAEALRGGPDGLGVIRRIVRESPRYLKPGGVLLFEIGAAQGAAARALVESVEGFAFVEIIRDYSGRDRVVAAGKNAT